MMNTNLMVPEALLLTKNEVRELSIAVKDTNKSCKLMPVLLDKILNLVKNVESNYLESDSLKVEKRINRLIRGAWKLLKSPQPDNNILEVLGLLKDESNNVGQTARKLLAFAY